MAKGGASENETCRELSRWWSDGKSSALFRRTQMSGGKATVRARKKKKTPYEYGDITFSEPEAKPLIDFFLIENKSGYKDLINVLDFVDSPSKHPQLWKWWLKAEGERRKSGRKHVALIFRRNRKSKCIMIRSSLFSEIENWCGTYDKQIITFNYENWKWVVVKFDSFLVWMPPETIYEMLK